VICPSWILKIDYDTVKLKVIYDVIKITLPKIRHQNDVTRVSIFKPLRQQNPGCAPGACPSLAYFHVHGPTLALQRSVTKSTGSVLYVLQHHKLWKICDVAMLYVKTIICGVAINSLEITLILQPACSDVKINLVRARENMLIVTKSVRFVK